MILIVGLGNPGKKFKKTRHNLGFRVVEELRTKNNLPKFQLKKRLSSLISEGEFKGKRILLTKPQTFMNNSGKAIKKIIEDYKLKIENLIVIHDDLDLPLGKIRISKGRGSAGHRGVQSIIDELKTKNFVRFRIGILPKWGKPKRTEKFVLKSFTKKEEEIIKKPIKEAVSAIEMVVKGGLEKAMQKFN